LLYCKHMKKAIIWILFLTILGVGTYTYLSRPVDTSNQPVVEGTELEQPQVGKLYRIDKEQSVVKFTIQEDLRGAPFTVVGETKDIRGDVTLSAGADPVLALGTIVVDVRTFKTDSAQRDGAINRLIVQTGTEGHEYAMLTNAKASGLPAVITEGAPFTFTVTGDLMLAGINKPATFSVTATQTESTLKGNMNSTLKRSDYKLVIPNIPFVANVPDTFTISADFVAVAQ